MPDDFVGQFGPQLTALVAYLTMVCRMPRLVVQRFLEGVLQIPISLGSTQAAWEEASAAVAAPYAELDANATINITKNFQILLSATNLLDETYHQYFANNGAGSVLADEYKFGRQYSAAIHWNF